MHEKQFDGSIERLRSPERVARLEVGHVAGLSLEAGKFKTVLEVGVGSGLFAEAFHHRGLKVSGVDINPHMLPAARQFVPQGNFQEASAEMLPFPDASFDLVFMGLVLHESDEPLKALQEARRVAQKRVCILIPSGVERSPCWRRVSHAALSVQPGRNGVGTANFVGMACLLLSNLRG
jgi:ubiquinone/menaquinone biosynthesis C-methylase UbiE